MLLDEVIVTRPFVLYVVGFYSELFAPQVASPDSSIWLPYNFFTFGKRITLHICILTRLFFSLELNEQFAPKSKRKQTNDSNKI